MQKKGFIIGAIVAGGLTAVFTLFNPIAIIMAGVIGASIGGLIGLFKDKDNKRAAYEKQQISPSVSGPAMAQGISQQQELDAPQQDSTQFQHMVANRRRQQGARTLS